MVNDYAYETHYYPRKANVIASALSYKAASAPIRDLRLRMTIISSLLDLIIEAHVERIKKLN